MSEELLLFLLESNQALTRQQLVTFVSHLLRLIGVDPAAYSGHSFQSVAPHLLLWLVLLTTKFKCWVAGNMTVTKLMFVPC